MFGIGVPELLLILVILLIFSGGKKLPELSKGVSSAIKELRRGFEDEIIEKKPKRSKKK